MTDDRTPVVLTPSDYALIEMGLVTREEVVEQKRAWARAEAAHRRMPAADRFRLRAIQAEWSDLEERWYDLALDESPVRYTDEGVLPREHVPDHTAEIAAAKARLLALSRERADIYAAVLPVPAEERERIRLENFAAAAEKSRYRVLDWTFLYAEPYEPRPRP